MPDTSVAVWVLADAGDGWHMGGWWLLMPVIGVVFMVVMMRGMFGGMSRGGRGQMAPMCKSHGDHDDHGEVEPALDVLRRRYAAGELSDQQFDAMRHKPEKGAGVSRVSREPIA